MVKRELENFADNSIGAPDTEWFQHLVAHMMEYGRKRKYEVYGNDGSSEFHVPWIYSMEWFRTYNDPWLRLSSLELALEFYEYPIFENQLISYEKLLVSNAQLKVFVTREAEQGVSWMFSRFEDAYEKCQNPQTGDFLIAIYRVEDERFYFSEKYSGKDRFSRLS